MATKEVAKRKKLLRSRSRSSRSSRRRVTRRRKSMHCNGKRKCFLGGSYLPKDATNAQYDGIPTKKNALITKASGADSFTGTRKELLNHADYMDFQGGVGDGSD